MMGVDESVDGQEDMSDDDNDEDPTLEHINIPHTGCVNRIRSMPQQSGIVATMADTGKAHIYNLTSCAQSMMNRAAGIAPDIPTGPKFTFSGHTSEGYGIAWSPVVPGRLATGDCNGYIYLWNVDAEKVQNAKLPASTVDTTPYLGHRNSIEDIAWSPSEATVFCTGSSDKSLRIWDIRGRNGSQITVPDAHFEDVNVISWNPKVSYLLASGADDGSFKVWDLRNIRQALPLANFQYHKGPITSIEWSYHDESLLSVSSSDDQVTIWDLSVEADEEQQQQEGENEMFAEYPPQLLFIHQGQHNVKELHFHPQIPNVLLTTAEDGFNIFKPAISVSTNA